MNSTSVPVRSYWKLILTPYTSNRMGTVAAITLFVIGVACFVGPFIWPYDPDKIGVAPAYSLSSWQHPLGGDKFGRDVVARLLTGGQVSLSVGLLVALTATIVGAVVGIISGYVGGIIDDTLMRFVDFLHSLPRIALLIVVSKLVGPSFWTMVIILSALGWTGTARIARGIALSIRETVFLEASRALGASDSRLMSHHIAPNAASAMIVAATLEAASAIRVESTLSFLGLGILPPTPTWGNLLSDSQSYFWVAPWQVVYPGMAILLTLLSFNLIGDALRDALDPLTKTGYERVSGRHGM